MRTECNQVTFEFHGLLQGKALAAHTDVLERIIKEASI